MTHFHWYFYCSVLEVSTSVTKTLYFENGCYYIKHAVTSNILLSTASSFSSSLKFFCELRLKAKTYRKSIERCFSRHPVILGGLVFIISLVDKDNFVSSCFYSWFRVVSRVQGMFTYLKTMLQLGKHAQETESNRKNADSNCHLRSIV